MAGKFLFYGKIIFLYFNECESIMSVKKIIKYPAQESELRKISEPITVFDKEVRNLARDLKDTALVNPAVGLAAPQIGVHLRAIVLRLGQAKTGDKTLGDPIVIINPEIVDDGPIVREYDACLSIPDLYAYTHRPSTLTIKGQNVNGEPISLKLSDLDATVAHHEVDHLNGVLFVDRLKTLKKDLYVILRFNTDDSFLVPYLEYLNITGNKELALLASLVGNHFTGDLYPIVNEQNKKKVLDFMIPD